jgi:hypothetical protein
VEGTAITAEGLRALVPLQNLVELRVGNCQKLSAEDFVELLPGFSRLRKLDLASSPIRMETAEVLATLTNLVELNLFGTPIGDQELALLPDLRRLKTIILQATRVTDEGVAAFELAHPQCKVER